MESEVGRLASQQNVPRITSIIGPIYEKMILKMPVEIDHMVSNKVMFELARVNPKARAVVIYNGVEPQKYLPLNSRSEYGKFILFIGRLVIRKNLQVVIHAFKDVARLMPEAKLIVIGEGPMHHEWQELVNRNDLSKNVLFLGHVSDQTKLELLTDCSALAFPSIEEGFGLVIIEAFAMSKPVLTSNVRPFDEIVDDNVDGFLLPPDDPAKWSEKIVYILTNSEVSKIWVKKEEAK